MGSIEWNDRFVLGVREFDDHHKHLVNLFNNAYDFFAAGSSAMNVEMVLDELIDYATYHFAADEYWMMENGYPQLAAHKKDHATFSNRVVAMQKEFLGRKGGLSLEVLAFIREWLTDHILTTDAEYGRFAVAGGGDG